MFTIKQDPDALDLTNHSQHLLSPSIDNEDEEEEYLPSEDDHQQANPYILKVIDQLIFAFGKKISSYNDSFRKQLMIVVSLIQVTRIMNMLLWSNKVNYHLYFFTFSSLYLSHSLCVYVHLNIYYSFIHSFILLSHT